MHFVVSSVSIRDPWVNTLVRLSCEETPVQHSAGRVHPSRIPMHWPIERETGIADTKFEVDKTVLSLDPACQLSILSIAVVKIKILVHLDCVKLEEFVAHASNVNCLKIGKKSSRVLVTGGEDHKVNMWAIGKPNAILSLSGHSSAVESVTFDSAEVLVVAGAASGTIKLWDLEEAKIVRTLTGHRSNCISVDFHPFGEFFASGSLDTNLKIWDIRRKGCIHTYKGHTRGVNAIKFSPDGRWVVSGGEDNIVKLWDLTAGKLMHDFKCHEGQIQCIDFHPHEFLLATGLNFKVTRAAQIPGDYWACVTRAAFLMNTVRIHVLGLFYDKSSLPG
eukprot:Gb_06353 [translate_table: standard]